MLVYFSRIYFNIVLASCSPQFFKRIFAALQRPKLSAKFSTRKQCLYCLIDLTERAVLPLGVRRIGPLELADPCNNGLGMFCMTKSGVPTLVCLVLVLSITGTFGSASFALEEVFPQVCRPDLGPSPTIELGQAGVFTWTCSGASEKGKGFYIVFIRPSGTYVLLKVPQGRTSFEFAPDAPGMWRWIVINTDPDRAKPDVESSPGHFQVVLRKDSAH
jgi:hypothetical protein